MLVKRPWYACTSLINKIKNLRSNKDPKPPYEFICQVGDPVLRAQASPVDPTNVRTPEIQMVLETMKCVMRRTHSIGISAPQVGCSLRIIMMEFQRAYIKGITDDVIRSREYFPFRLKVFLNPTMEVVNNQKIWFPESCESIRGYSAEVPRYYEVKISGLNENAEHHEWQAKGWSARIIQHEMDHLEGSLYIDRMDTRTYQYLFWQAIKRLPSSY